LLPLRHFALAAANVSQELLLYAICAPVFHIFNHHATCLLPVVPSRYTALPAGKVSKLSLRMMFENYKRPKSKL
jgi:hypothetical protein